MTRSLSVRARLAIAVGALTAAALSATAALAPSFVEASLKSDLLEAEADDALALAAFPIDADSFNNSFVVDVTGELIDISDLDDPSILGFEDFPFLVDSERIEQEVEQQIALLQNAAQFDRLVDAAGGEFAVTTGYIGGGYAVIDANGNFVLEDGDLGDLAVPVIPELELQEFIFNDLGIFEAANGQLVDTFDEGSSVIIGVADVDGIDILVAADASSIDRSVRRVRYALWLGVPVLTLLIAGVAWLLASRALRPVRLITDRAATISGGTLNERVPVPTTRDEVSTLATTVNEMLDRLESDDHRRLRFISDASHELRSPVAVIRNEAEVVLAHPDGADASELATAVSAETIRMATIIDDLLALARHDEHIAPARTEVDLDDIVLDEAGRTRRVSIETSGVSAGRVMGRSDEMARMVGHLLDNAARHADGVVGVSLVVEHGEVILRVDDDGPGVPAADQDRIFERFSRLDEARSRDRGGAGLGLAVVAGIAERSGGTASVGDSELGGAQFVIRLPGAGPDLP